MPKAVALNKKKNFAWPIQDRCSVYFRVIAMSEAGIYQIRNVQKMGVHRNQDSPEVFAIQLKIEETA